MIIKALHDTPCYALPNDLEATAQASARYTRIIGFLLHEFYNDIS